MHDLLIISVLDQISEVVTWSIQIIISFWVSQQCSNYQIGEHVNDSPSILFPLIFYTCAHLLGIAQDDHIPQQSFVSFATTSNVDVP